MLVGLCLAIFSLFLLGQNIYADERAASNAPFVLALLELAPPSASPDANSITHTQSCLNLYKNGDKEGSVDCMVSDMSLI